MSVCSLFVLYVLQSLLFMRNDSKHSSDVETPFHDCPSLIHQFQKYQCSPVNLIAAAKGSAARLVNLLADDFRCFRDEHRFENRRKPIRILKRAQIFAADVWAAFEGKDYGEFRDIDKITMFADYRVPQILNTMGCIAYSPPLDAIVRDKKEIQSGSNRELQLRGAL